MLTKKDSPKKEAKNSKSAAADTHAGCCTPPAKAPNQLPAKKEKQKDLFEHPKTRITIKYDSGFPNQIFIRGKGANLSWEKGLPLKNVKSDEWVWETDAPFTQCEFKVLINDRIYENGDNHLLNAGATLLYTPHFY